MILLALQTDRLEQTVELDETLLGLPPAALIEAIAREPGRAGQPLPDGAEALTLRLRSEPGNSNLELAARIIDGFGQVHMRQFRTNTTSVANEQWNTMRTSLSGLTQPLRIAAIVMRPQARIVRAPTGTLLLDDLTALIGEDGGRGRVVRRIGSMDFGIGRRGPGSDRLRKWTAGVPLVAA